MQQSTMVTFLVIVLGIGSGLFCARVASAKGFDGVSSFLGGLLFNLIALIAVAGPSMKSEAWAE